MQPDSNKILALNMPYCVIFFSCYVVYAITMIPDIFNNYTNSQLDQLIVARASTNHISVSTPPRPLATPGAILAIYTICLFDNGTAAADVHVIDMDEASREASRPPHTSSEDLASIDIDL